MERPKSQKQLKSFLGKVSYLRRFIPALAEVSHPLTSLLKYAVTYRWLEEHQTSFDNIKKALTSMATMIPLKKGISLLLYLTSTVNSIGVLLAQKEKGIEKPIYHFSRMFVGPEKRYLLVERHCLALIFVAQKLRHYLLAFSVHIITRCDPIKFLLAKTILMGRSARWFLILSEYELKWITQRL